MKAYGGLKETKSKGKKRRRKEASVEKGSRQLISECVFSLGFVFVLFPLSSIYAYVREHFHFVTTKENKFDTHTLILPITVTDVLNCNF